MQVTIFYLLSHVKRQHLDCSNERTGPFAAIHILHSKHHFSKKRKAKEKTLFIKRKQTILHFPGGNIAISYELDPKSTYSNH